MYAKIPNGKLFDIQGLKCWVPPLGYGVHTETGEIGTAEIIKRSEKKSEQYWEPNPLPDDFEELEAEAAEIQKTDPTYEDAAIEIIKEREWRRRWYGVWFYNNGEPVYLTGLHYFFLSYWNLDTGLPDFREIDVEYFYFWQYCVEDPKCFGMIEIRKRRDGKSYRAGCMLYECISRVYNALGGIQSKTDNDAAEFFEKTIVTQFGMLPSFFRPIWDTSAGPTPKGSLRFFKPSKKGAAAKTNLRGKELKSKIDFRSSKPKAYDGSKTKRLVLDESGKVETDVIKRHLIVKHCCLDNKKRVIGKMIVTSTCEEIGLEYRFDKLWKWSDQNNREESTGGTISGMYQFFMPADRAGGYDIYGVPATEETRAQILAERKTLQSSPDDLIEAIRKEPLTIVEAFKVAEADCVFDFMKLSDRDSILGYETNLFTRGNFEWENGVRFSRVVFRPNLKGRWDVSHLLSDEDSNKVIRRGNRFIPDNKVNFCGGGDPFDINKTKDKKGGSRGSLYIKWRFSVHHQNNPNNNNLIVRYANRPSLSDEYYEDVLMTLWYYGCDGLLERNKYGIIKYMVFHGCEAFLIMLPGESDYGIYASYESNQELTRVTKDFINKRGQDIMFRPLISQYMKFDPSNTQPYDEAMGAGYALMADAHHIPTRSLTEGRQITDYFRKAKIA